MKHRRLFIKKILTVIFFLMKIQFPKEKILKKKIKNYIWILSIKD
jgi:hypothetical protein